jgi:hypothetical protein
MNSTETDKNTSRTYMIGLPVSVTIGADGRVTWQVVVDETTGAMLDAIDFEAHSEPEVQADIEAVEAVLATMGDWDHVTTPVEFTPENGWTLDES